MLFAVVIAPFVLAILLMMFGRFFGKYVGYVAVVLPALIFYWFLNEIPAVVSKGIGTVYLEPWLPSFGVNISFQVDGLSLLFSLLIAGVGFLVYWYSIGYLASTERLVNFYAILLIFTGSMLGVVLSQNLILTFMFWELTSFSSFLLIGYSDHRARSRYGAQKALYITVIGGFALFAAVVLVGRICGSYEMSQIIANKNLLFSSPLYTAIVLLILLGAFTKSAQIPFHIWLPDAMEAPTPISCYLHSATMVKVGIFLLLLMSEPLGGTAIWFVMVSTFGILSLIWGAYRALKQTDLKAILAFSTISQLGLVITLIGYGSRAAIIAALFHLLNHSVFKGSLFLVTGMVDHATGTRDIRLLGGLSKAMPITSALALCGGFAMAGLPPFNGFLSKEMFFESSIEAVRGNLGVLGDYALLFPAFAVVASIFTFLYCMIIVFKVFYGGHLTEKAPHHPHEPEKMMLIPCAIMASGTILAALFANYIAEALLIPAAFAVTGTHGELHISFWHGINLPLAMTIIVIGCGVYLFRRLDRFLAFLHRAPEILSGDKVYDWLIPRNGLVKGANHITNFYMTGRLQNYVQFICISFVLITVYIMVFKGAFVIDYSDLAPIKAFEAMWIAVLLIATFITVVSKGRTVSLISVGIVGYSIAFLFVIFSAPDLALTQMVIESISIVLFFLAFRYLPRDYSEKDVSIIKKSVNILISLAVGAAVTVIALIGHSNKLFDTISGYYVENSKILGGGYNVVNVILVDFRGLDTMGEITVISIAAIGVFILISLTVGEKSETAAENHKGGDTA